jgi:serine/threonine protein kinase
MESFSEKLGGYYKGEEQPCYSTSTALQPSNPWCTDIPTETKDHTSGCQTWVNLSEKKSSTFSIISANNVLVMEKKGIVKLADFGLSQLKSFAKSDVGTSCYQAPEVIRGKKYNYKADIW